MPRTKPPMMARKPRSRNRMKLSTDHLDGGECIQVWHENIAADRPRIRQPMKPAATGMNPKHLHRIVMTGKQDARPN